MHDDKYTMVGMSDDDIKEQDRIFNNNDFGKWEVRDTGLIYIARVGNVLPICGCGFGIDKDGNYMATEKEVKKNLKVAKLIAAAPDLLTALELAVKDLCSGCAGTWGEPHTCEKDGRCFVHKYIKLIEKVKGE